jgi:hypothetical protein
MIKPVHKIVDENISLNIHVMVHKVTNGFIYELVHGMRQVVWNNVNVNKGSIIRRHIALTKKATSNQLKDAWNICSII